MSFIISIKIYDFQFNAFTCCERRAGSWRFLFFRREILLKRGNSRSLRKIEIITNANFSPTIIYKQNRAFWLLPLARKHIRDDLKIFYGLMTQTLMQGFIKEFKNVLMLSSRSRSPLTIVNVMQFNINVVMWHNQVTSFCSSNRFLKTKRRDFYSQASLPSVANGSAFPRFVFLKCFFVSFSREIILAFKSNEPTRTFWKKEL